MQLKRGDTLIEVVFAIVIFSIVSVITINAMNKGVATAQTALEIQMARNEIDAQAEALRFIHTSFQAERELDSGRQQFVELWRKITRDSFGAGYAIDPDQLSVAKHSSCLPYYDQNHEDSLFNDRAFVLNTRLLQPSDTRLDYNDFFGNDDTGNNYSRFLDDMVVSSLSIYSNKFQPAPVSPRIVYSYGDIGEDSESGSMDESNLGNRLYRKIRNIEGIWVIAVRGGEIYAATNQPEYYDFYIRTCWDPLDSTTASHIDTVVRLYNPEIIDPLPEES